MKFSDAMMIGMSTYPLVAGSLASDGAFCALGAGYRSLGWIDEYGEFIDPGQVLHGYEGRIVHWLKADATDSPCGSAGELRKVPTTLVGSIYSCGMGVIADCDDECEYLREDILGWMPLPEPPK